MKTNIDDYYWIFKKEEGIIGYSNNIFDYVIYCNNVKIGICSTLQSAQVLCENHNKQIMELFSK